MPGDRNRSIRLKLTKAQKSHIEHNIENIGIYNIVDYFRFVSKHIDIDNEGFKTALSNIKSREKTHETNIVFKVTEKEKQRIEKHIKILGVSLSDYVFAILSEVIDIDVNFTFRVE